MRNQRKNRMRTMKMKNSKMKTKNLISLSLRMITKTSRGLERSANTTKR